MAKDFQGARAVFFVARNKEFGAMLFFFWFLMNLEKVSNARGVAG